jgi:hypothetical protein
MKHIARIAAEKNTAIAFDKFNAAKTDAEAESAFAEYQVAVKAECEADSKYPT